MTPAIIAQLLIAYGPTVLPLVQKLIAWIESGKKDVTSADIAELIAYGNKTSADYLKDAGISKP